MLLSIEGKEKPLAIRPSEREEIMLKKMRVFGLAFFSCVVLSIAFFQAPTISHGFDIAIEVAPSTLNIQSSGQVVTVHTGIAYSSVSGGTVTLNGIDIAWWKADNQGNFVAKFLMSEIKALADAGVLQVPGENELILVGYTTDGADFTGKQTVTVINVLPSGSGGK
jgi:hypothetical protein